MWLYASLLTEGKWHIWRADKIKSLFYLFLSIILRATGTNRKYCCKNGALHSFIWTIKHVMNTVSPARHIYYKWWYNQPNKQMSKTELKTWKYRGFFLKNKPIFSGGGSLSSCIYIGLITNHYLWRKCNLSLCTLLVYVTASLFSHSVVHIAILSPLALTLTTTPQISSL